MMHISPTQIEKYRRCHRLIGYEYVENIKAPSSKKQEFGSAVHAKLETWLRGGKMPDDSPEGKTAKQAILRGWLPVPSPALLVETEFVIPVSDTLEISGRIDCIAPPDKNEYAIVIDHKTTSSLKWAKKTHELWNDPQAAIYSVYAALTYSAQYVKARWVYYAASNPVDGGMRRPTGAMPVEICFDVASAAFIEQWEQIQYDCAAIERIRTQQVKACDLAATPASCTAFGGCFFREHCNFNGDLALQTAIENDKKERGK